MPAKKICLLAVIALSITIAIVCARPFWCPDLTDNNFVNFPDFAVQANYWRQSGTGLSGDFFFNYAVDINDFAYLALWWLHDCYDPPAEFCPDCIYPDCNVMDCNAPTVPVPCPSCDTTTPFIKVALTGNIACGCKNGIDELGYCCLGSYYTTGSFDGAYLVPYTDYCRWYGVYDINNIVYTGYWNCDCSIAINSYFINWVTITVERSQNEIHIEFLAYENYQYPGQLPDAVVFINTVSAVGATNCVEMSINDSDICEELPHIPDSGCSINPLWAGGTATLTIPP